MLTCTEGAIENQRVEGLYFVSNMLHMGDTKPDVAIIEDLVINQQLFPRLTQGILTQ